MATKENGKFTPNQGTPIDEIVPNKMYSVTDVAATLGCPTYQVRKAAERGELAITQMGVSTKVLGSNLLKFLEAGNFKNRTAINNRGGARNGSGRKGPLSGAAADAHARKAGTNGAETKTVSEAEPETSAASAA